MTNRPVLLVLRPLPQCDRNYLEAQLSRDFEVVIPQEFSADSLLRHVESADVILGLDLPEPLARAAKRLKIFHCLGAGVDHMALEELAKLGIAICNSHSTAKLVAEHAIAMLLASVKRIALHDRLMRQDIFYRPSGDPRDRYFQSNSLIGAQIGIVGFGHIGRAVAQFLLPFSRDILILTRNPDHHRDDIARIPNAHVVSKNELFEQSDAVILCLPLTKATRGFVDRSTLERMKKGAYLVNVSRADVVDVQAIVDALEVGNLGGFAVDAWAQKSDEISALSKFENVVLSPHRAATRAGISPSMQGIVENLKAFVEAGVVKNQIDVSAGY